jgi:hypothetical protein
MLPKSIDRCAHHDEGLILDGRPVDLDDNHKENTMSRPEPSKRLTRSCSLTLALVATIAGCEGTPTHDQPAAPTAGPIYHGTLEGSQSSGAIKLLRNNVFVCSGDIVSQYWVVTAASCINSADDANGDRVVSFSEGAGNYTVTGGPDSSGGLATYSAYQILVHPNGTFGTGGTVNAAMIFISPGSAGHSIQNMDPLKYTNGTLNVYQGSAASIVGSNLLTYGFGAVGPSNLDQGNRHFAWKTLQSAYQEISYNGTLLNNSGTLAGTSCTGDIGGPDFYWDGAKLNLLGIHSMTVDPACTGGFGGAGGGSAYDINAVAASWRSWVASTALTCPATTRSGRCHF